MLGYWASINKICECSVFNTLFFLIHLILQRIQGKRKEAYLESPIISSQKTWMKVTKMVKENLNNDHKDPGAILTL